MGYSLAGDNQPAAPLATSITALCRRSNAVHKVWLMIDGSMNGVAPDKSRAFSLNQRAHCLDRRRKPCEAIGLNTLFSTEAVYCARIASLPQWPNQTYRYRIDRDCRRRHMSSLKNAGHHAIMDTLHERDIAGILCEYNLLGNDATYQ